MSYEPAALPTWDRPVMGIDIFNHIAGNKSLKIARGHRARVHRSVMDGLRVWQNNNHLFRALGKSSFYGLRHVNLVTPLLSTNGITVKGVHHRVAPRLLANIAGRQEH